MNTNQSQEPSVAVQQGWQLLEYEGRVTFQSSEVRRHSEILKMEDPGEIPGGRRV